MATVPLLSDEAAPEASRVTLDAIRAARGAEPNNFWRALAHDPDQLAETWAAVNAALGPGVLDPLVKEMIYVAVSVANSCAYCVHSHTAAAKAKGMTPAMHAELLRVVQTASRTNALATALGVEVDERFRA